MNNGLTWRTLTTEEHFGNTINPLYKTSKIWRVNIRDNEKDTLEEPGQRTLIQKYEQYMSTISEIRQRMEGTQRK